MIFEALKYPHKQLGKWSKVMRIGTGNGEKDAEVENVHF